MERQFDVIVVGGGTAGFAAAVTAARGGAKTLLIEEKAYLGGTATGAQVSMFMGFADGEPDRPQQGIIKDVMDGLAAAGGTPGIETIYLCGRRDPPEMCGILPPPARGGPGPAPTEHPLSE